jgi:hypothetical protein
MTDTAPMSDEWLAENWRDAAYAERDAARAVLRSLVAQHMGCPICSGPLWAEGVTHEAGCSLAAALGADQTTRPSSSRSPEGGNRDAGTETLDRDRRRGRLLHL